MASNVDLIFLGARRAVGHVVLFGEARESLQQIATLSGDENVAHLPQGALAIAGKEFFWRVDALLVDGTKLAGEVWTFTTDTGGRMLCSATHA